MADLFNKDKGFLIKIIECDMIIDYCFRGIGMLERKYGNRSNWKRVVKRSYKQTFLNTKEFSGYITLLSIEKVSEPLFVQYKEKRVCIVDDGYSWLQHFPSTEHYSLTTMFNSDGEIVQWYIDICHINGVENGVPWLEDLFLDIIVLPNGDVHLIDIDELEEALRTGIIDQTLYNLAWAEAERIKNLINIGKFDLINLSKEHKGALINRIIK